MSIHRALDHPALSPMDQACHEACRHMHGYSMCRCGDKGERPCTTVEKVVHHIAVLVRDADHQQAVEDRRAKLLARKRSTE